MTRQKQTCQELRMVAAVRRAHYPGLGLGPCGDPNETPDVVLTDADTHYGFEVTAATSPYSSKANREAASLEALCRFARRHGYEIVFDASIPWTLGSGKAEKKRDGTLKQLIEEATKNPRVEANAVEIPGVASIRQWQGSQRFAARSESTIDAAVRDTIRRKTQSVESAMKSGRLLRDQFEEFNLVIHAQSLFLAPHSSITETDVEIFLTNDQFWLGSFDRVFVTFRRRGWHRAQELVGRMSDEERFKRIVESEGFVAELACEAEEGEVGVFTGTLDLDIDSSEAQYEKMSNLSLVLRNAAKVDASNLPEHTRLKVAGGAVALQVANSGWTEIGALTTFWPDGAGPGTLLVCLDVSR